MFKRKKADSGKRAVGKWTGIESGDPTLSPLPGSEDQSDQKPGTTPPNKKKLVDGRTPQVLFIIEGFEANSLVVQGIE